MRASGVSTPLRARTPRSEHGAQVCRIDHAVAIDVGSAGLPTRAPRRKHQAEIRRMHRAVVVKIRGG